MLYTFRASVTKTAALVLLLGCTMMARATNVLPALSQVKAVNDKTKKTLTINYLLSDKDDPSVSIRLKVSTDGGLTYTVISQGVTGDIGWVKTGHRSLQWKYTQLPAAGLRYQLIADDGHTPDVAELLKEVDTARLRRNLQSVAVVRDGESETGKKNLQLIRNNLTHTLQQEKYTVEHQPFHYGTVDGINLIGKKRGTEKEEKIYVLCAAYDGSSSESPNANNNASGVAGMMEIAEILSKYSLKSTVVMLATDYTGEEFIGSNWYVFHGGIKDREQMEGAIDLDRIGTYSDHANTHIIGESKPVLFPQNCKYIEQDSLRANFIKVVCNTRSLPLADLCMTAAKTYAPQLKAYMEEFPGYGEFSVGTEDFLQFSDHIAFWYHRYKCIWITDAREGIRRDSTPDDNIGHINFEFMGNAVKIALATLVDMAGLEHSVTYEGSF